MVLTRSRSTVENTLFAVWNRKLCYSEGAIIKKRPAYKSKLATNVFLGRALGKQYTDKMLEIELNGDVVIPSPKVPVPIGTLLNKLFPPKAVPYSIDTIFNTVRSRVMKRNPGFTDKDWWESWLKQLSAPEFEGYAEDGDDDDDKLTEAEKSSREVRTAKFLQALCDEIMAAFPALGQHAHQWTSYFHTKPVDTIGDVSMPRKPDVSCLKAYIPVEEWRKNEKPVTWKHLDTILEDKLRRKSTVQFLNQVATDLYNKVYLIFVHQDGRRFVIVLSFTGDLFRVSVMDRSGVVHSDAMSYHKHPKTFLKAIIGLTFSPDEYLGYDPTFVDRPLLNTQTIMVGDRNYTVLSTVWRQGMILGRATACWRVMYNGVEYLIKDSWVLELQKPNEIYHLREAAGVEGVPEVEDWEDVVIRKRLDSTDNNRGVYRPLLNRVHRRIVFKTVGVPIWDFLTRRELVLVYISLLECHLRLIVKRKILHCDISLYNLMINKITRKGLLIDYDYSKDLDESRQTSKPYPSTPDIWPRNEKKDEQEFLPPAETTDSATEETLTAEDVVLQKSINEEHNALTKAFFEKHGQRTGTQPFMAGELLAGKNVVHLPRHDLESFLYVFLYQCCMCLGPKGYMKNEKNAPAFLYSWLHPEIQSTPQDLGAIKMGWISASRTVFRENVSSQFTPYMSVFATCVENLQALFKNREQVEVTHEAIIAEFNKVLKELPEERAMIPRDIPRAKEAARSRQLRRLNSRIRGVPPLSLYPPTSYMSADPNIMTTQDSFLAFGPRRPGQTPATDAAATTGAGVLSSTPGPTEEKGPSDLTKENEDSSTAKIGSGDRNTSSTIATEDGGNANSKEGGDHAGATTNGNNTSAPKADTTETKPSINRAMRNSPTLVSSAESEHRSTSENLFSAESTVTESREIRTAALGGLNVTTQRKENTKKEANSSKNTASSFESANVITPNQQYSTTTTKTATSSAQTVSFQSANTIQATVAQSGPPKSIGTNNISVPVSKPKPSERPTKIPQASTDKTRSLSVSSQDRIDPTQNLKARSAKLGTSAEKTSGSGSGPSRISSRPKKDGAQN